jgi:tetratricopeptide (TPR) repeat protein
VTEQVQALHAQGVAANAAGQPVRAARAFRRALAMLNGRTDSFAARLLLGLALSETEIGGVAQGLPHLVEAQRLAGESGEVSVQALVHGQHGLLLWRSGRLDEAQAKLDEAVRRLDHLDLVDQCRVLLNRGGVSLRRGEVALAQADSQRCVELAHRGGLTSIECRARHNLGYVAFLRGNLPAALGLMDEAQRLGPDVIPGIARLDRASVLVEAGLTREADEMLAEASAIFATNRLALYVAEVDVARAGCALLDGNLLAARRDAMRARTRLARIGNDRWRRSAELLILQADVARGRTGPRLEQRGHRLAVELAADGLAAQSRAALLVTAEALLGRGLVPEARAAIESVGPARTTDPVATRLRTRYLHARLAQVAGDLAAATRAVRSGLADLAGHQARFGSIDLRTASAVHGRRLAELGVLVAVEHGRADAVFAASERGRGASSRLPPVRPPADDHTAELLGQLRQVVENARAGNGDPAELRRRRNDLERRITARSWEVPGIGSMGRPASLGAVRAAVTATDSTLLAYSQAGEQLHAIVVGARGTVVRRPDRSDEALEALRRVRADLDGLAQPWLPGGLRAAAAASLTSGLASLDELLLAPLRLPDSRLIVVPTGALGAVPWGMLPSMRGVPVTVTPSATGWLDALRDRPAPGGPTVALAGPGLVRADHEAAAVADAYAGVRSLTGAAAIRTTLRSALAEAGLVHVDAHGRHQTENPLFSSIRLADGPLFAYELDRAAPHVIMSACELGLATIRPGDEALGLTSVLLQLGSRCVVAGVARVHDDVAAEVMTRYHRGLSAGRDSAEALAAALPERLDHPAPFACFGAQWRKPNRATLGVTTTPEVARSGSTAERPPSLRADGRSGS